MYKEGRSVWKKPAENLGEIQKKRLVRWRVEPVVNRADRPTRPDRARSLGYKAKQGFCVIRVRINKGGRKVPDFAGGRRPKRAGRFFTLNKSKQLVAEEKAAAKYRNMEVLNSYWVGEDGKSIWYEVILADPSHPSVKKSDTKWVASVKHKSRANRGLTSSGKKTRGLLHKGRK
ncbi:MAG: 50S ribosomal protein L15e [Candidatus Aenigmatarchaeota archaeon]|nr:MAG: 50S ribosomal protein L15e [Candidatus Aenigmarchaeota archaeon]